MAIPKQLKREDFRFVPIKEGMKNPFESDWQDSNNYGWNHNKIQNCIGNGGNYGIVCGYGNLVVIDADIQEVADAVTNELPPTFTVRTGGGGFHFYYICGELEKTIRLEDEKTGDVGDIQCYGKQVVGPGSTHPNGNKYKVEKNHEIAKTNLEDIKFALRDWLKDVEDSKEASEKEEIDIQIDEVLDLTGLKRQGNEYYGEHPKHGSSTGRNFWVNESANVWHCFRHDTGGGPLQWLAVKENIIDCSDAVKGALKDTEKFREVLNELEKRGLWEPSDNGDRSKLPYFTKKGKFIPRALADDIISDNHFVTHLQSEEIYVYEDGIYKDYGRQRIKEEAQKRLGSMVKTHYVNETVNAIRRQTYVPQEEFGGPRNLLACENGILNIETGQLSDFDPDIIMLSKIPVEYDEDADCPKCKEFIGEIVHDDDVKLIQEMFGYCLLKDYPIARAFMLIGSGANGKSTLLKLLTRLLGEDNVTGPALQELLSNRFKKIELHGSLANIHADLSADELEDTGTFKMLTGGDKIMGEKKQQDPIEFYNYAKLIYSANEFPGTQDRTMAFFRRWIVIDFPNQFPEGEEDTDPNILEKLTTDEELSGLLNWALEGLNRVLKNGHFSRTASREDIEEEWIRRTDSLRAFIDEWVQVDQDLKITKDLFYQLYKGYCAEHDLFTKEKGPVTKTLPSKIPQTEIFKPEIDGKQIRCWRDIDIKPEILEKDWANNMLKRMVNDSNRQDRQVFSTSLSAEKNNSNTVYMNNLESVDYPVYNEDKEDDQESLDLITERQEITKLLKDGMARTPKDISDELDIVLEKVVKILSELYKEDLVKRKPGPEKEETYYHLTEGES